MKTLHKAAIVLVAMLSLAQAGQWSPLEPLWRADGHCAQPVDSQAPTYTRAEFAQAIGSAIRGDRAAP